MILETIFVMIVFIIWSVAMLAMIRIWFNGFMAGDCGWSLNRTVMFASYNSKYFRIFIASVLGMIAIVIILNLLFLKGVIK
jgi:hypothetical protein